MREQLSAQLLLGIVSQQLAAGTKLPSVRELARRLQIHANTVSAAYQDLAARGWVEQRKGSGVYVREVGLGAQHDGIEGFVRAWVEAATARGFDVAELETTLARVAHEQRRKEFVVVDPDQDLARILAAEISEGLGYAVRWTSFEHASEQIREQSSVLALPSNMPRALKEFGGARERLMIVVRSLDDLLVGYQRPTANALIGLVSRSESIRRWSATLLSALGFPPDAVLLRSPDEPQWKRGLAACRLVAADVESFPELPHGVNGRLMKIVSEDFVKELANQGSTSKRSA